MGGMFDPKEQEMESTSEVGLPEEYKPYVRGALSRAQQLSNVPVELPDFAMTTPMDPRRTEGLNMATDIARGGGSVVGNAVDNLNAVLSGDFLAPDAIQQATTGAVNRAIPSVNSAFYGQGGGGALRDAAMTEALGNVMSDYYGSERDRQMMGLNLAPSIEALSYSPAESLMSAGAAFEAQDREELAERIYRHDFAQNEPRERLGRYIGNLSSMLPFAGQVQRNNWTEYGPSPFETALGFGGAVVGLGGPSGLNLWGGGAGTGGGPSMMPQTYGRWARPGF